MTTPIIVGLIVLAILGVIMLSASLRRRDTKTAIGQLSGETVKRDRSSVTLTEEGVAGAGEGDAAPTGKAVEAAARGARTGAVVPVAAVPPVVYTPPDPETLGVSRRQFLNRSIVAVSGLLGGIFGLAILAQLWPKPQVGFGGKIDVGKIADIKNEIAAGNGFYYFPQGRMWITEYPQNGLVKAQAQYDWYDKVEQGLSAGVTALFQTCPHLGCRVPSCETSQWFECPCHGSQYNQAGEKKGGPAPRGMDRFSMTVNGGILTVDTGDLLQGPPIGVNTTGQEAEGPNCLSSGGGH